MSPQPDYKHLYNLLRLRRREELDQLDKFQHAISDLYVQLVTRDAQYARDGISWERELMGQALIPLTRVLDATAETDEMMRMVLQSFPPECLE